jgi:hypothetical protein
MRPKQEFIDLDKLTARTSTACTKPSLPLTWKKENCELPPFSHLYAMETADDEQRAAGDEIPAANGRRRRTVGGVYASACLGRLAGRARASGVYAGERWTPGRLIW